LGPWPAERGPAGTGAERWAGCVEGVDEFDPAFFGLSADEAARMCPQHRLLLLEAWRALEHAGQVPDGRPRDRAGIYVGVGTSDHARRLPAGDPDVYAGHQSAALPARLAYLLNWRGPCLAVDTACTSSFTALESRGGYTAYRTTLITTCAAYAISTCPSQEYRDTEDPNTEYRDTEDPDTEYRVRKTQVKITGITPI
jgi:hypothetical protein